MPDQSEPIPQPEPVSKRDPSEILFDARMLIEGETKGLPQEVLLKTNPPLAVALANVSAAINVLGLARELPLGLTHIGKMREDSRFPVSRTEETLGLLFDTHLRDKVEDINKSQDIKVEDDAQTISAKHSFLYRLGHTSTLEEKKQQGVLESEVAIASKNNATDEPLRSRVEWGYGQAKITIVFDESEGNKLSFEFDNPSPVISDTRHFTLKHSLDGTEVSTEFLLEPTEGRIKRKNIDGYYTDIPDS